MTTETAPCGCERQMMVLSLKPRFADMILAGAKSVELRRVKPTILLPAQALLYASSPEKAMVGDCWVVEADSAPVSTLWDAYRSQAGLSRSEFRGYLAGAAAGTALTLAGPRLFERPVALSDLRDHGLRPPQSYSYINKIDGQRLMALGQPVGADEII